MVNKNRYAPVGVQFDEPRFLLLVFPYRDFLNSAIMIRTSSSALDGPVDALIIEPGVGVSGFELFQEDGSLVAIGSGSK